MSGAWTWRAGDWGQAIMAPDDEEEIEVIPQDAVVAPVVDMPGL